jgi:polyhydroxybutyrate depolymerase
VTVGRLERHAILHVPARVTATAMPLVIMLHGAGGTGAGAIGQTGWAAKADEKGFYALFPDARPAHPERRASFLFNPQFWKDGSGRGVPPERDDEDVRFIRALLAEMRARYKVDDRRVYVTGFSSGASMTWRLGVTLSAEIAAIAPVSGHLWLEDAKLARPVSAIAIYGAEDPLNPIAGGEAKNPWGESVTKPPIARSIERWRALAGLSGATPETRVDGPVRVERWRGPDAEFAVYTIAGMGHVWPGGRNFLPERWVGKDPKALSATDVIWDFFERHPRP